MNIVALLGRCTRDPEVRYLPNGTAVCTVGIAVDERYKDRSDQWQSRANFFDVTIWGKRGEAFAKYHKRGALACVHGRLRWEQWDDKATGQKRSKVSVVADEWHFATSGNSQRGDGNSEPWQGSGDVQPPGQSSGGQRLDAAAAGIDLDDTPF